MKHGKRLFTFVILGCAMALGTSCQTGSKSSLTTFPTSAKVKKSESQKKSNLVAQAVPVEEGERASAPPQMVSTKAGAEAAEEKSADREPASAPGIPQKKETPPRFILASAGNANQNKPEGHTIPSMVGSHLLVRTTAYCHKEADSLPYGKLNAAGGQLQYGSTIRSAAADWSRFPLGTRFRIQGQPYEYVIDDYGSALVGTNTIDLYKPTFTAMNEWGARRVPIQIIEWGCFEKSRKVLASRRHVRHAEHVRQMLREIEARYVTGYQTAQSDAPFARPRISDSEV